MSFNRPIILSHFTFLDFKNSGHINYNDLCFNCTIDSNNFEFFLIINGWHFLRKWLVELHKKIKKMSWHKRKERKKNPFVQWVIILFFHRMTEYYPH